MKVFVTGGNGYVGIPIVRALLAHGHKVIALQRPGSERPLQLSHHNLTVYESDLFDIDSLARGMESGDAVVHLVGIIRERPQQRITMQRIHVQGTASVVTAALQAQVPRCLHMSALGARPNASSKYHQSKWDAEQLVQKSGLDYTIFRPSVIFGQGGPGPNFVQQLRDLVTSAPICPVVGDGEARLQPVSVETVAEAFATALDSEIGSGQVYEVGGPDVITYAHILELLAAAERRPLRRMHVPMGMMGWLAKRLEHFPAFPITTDQLTMLSEGNVCSDSEPLYRDFRLTPIPFSVQ